MTGLLKSARWAATAQFSKVGGQLVSLVVLSRLLPPSDYGVMAMAGVVTALAGMLRDMGTGAAIIQRKELTPDLTCTVFWMNMALGTALGLALWLGGDALGAFFREPKLPGVLLALAVLFPLTSFTAVHQAIIERGSGFKTLALLDVTNQVLGLILAIIAALAGAGVYSLVAPMAVSAIISSIWLWKKSGWRPSWRWSTPEFNALWGFTGNLTAFNFVNYFARNADSMIIGRMLGTAALGHYSMAYKLMLFPVQNLGWVVSRVLLPRLSQLQNEPERVRDLYFKTLYAVMTISTPLMAGLWVLRDPFVVLTFGPKWSEVASLVTWLAPVGLLQSMLATVGTVFTAAGSTRTLFRLGVANTLMCIAGFIIGAQWGLMPLAIAYLVANVINVITVLLLTASLIGAPLSGFWTAIRAPVVSASSMIMLMVLLKLFFVPSNVSPLIEVMVIGSCGFVLYGLILKTVFGQSWKPILDLVRPAS